MREMSKIYEHIYDLAKPHLNTRNNDIHTEVAYRFALRLLEDEPGDPDVAIPAIICHDIGWIKLPEALHSKAFGPGFDPDLRRIHEVEGVELAREILRCVDYDPQKSREILEIIDGHDSRLEAISDSDKIVKDADKLWRVTAEGLAIDADWFRQEPEEHLHWTAAQVDSWFFTGTGRQLAWAALEKAGYSP
ncbi:HD domain-containing protein [Geobacter grbiciae]|uniref:HD domain-containing protein n=1 Tax=Geobacter grbiciae TaxID=155042 RepID=UPI001C0190AB|nr:HD domain-containing protein [Geobacter grbiciae]MBT1076520.1 HD domain-containing protein [Geobacter grbiciae]